MTSDITPSQYNALKNIKVHPSHYDILIKALGFYRAALINEEAEHEERDFIKAIIEGRAKPTARNAEIEAVDAIMGYLERLNGQHQQGERQPAISDSPNDQCECGDYRSDHRDGTGPCSYNKMPRFDITHGGQDCLKFRLVGLSEPTPTPRRKQ